MTAQDLLEDRHRPQAGRGLEQWHDLGLKHLGERIGPSSAAWAFLAEGRRGSALMRWPVAGLKVALAAAAATLLL
ncbi:hypothetical protein JCM16408A_53740 [Methylobacterium phyllosphaerae]